MKPLREAFDPNDLNEVAGAALLRRVPPLEDSAARRRRVRITLQGTSPQRSVRILSPVLAAGFLLIAATGATATAARLWKRAHLEQASETAARAAIEAAPRAPAARLPSVVLAAPETKVAAAQPLPEARSLGAVTRKFQAAPKAAVAPRAITSTPADPESGPGASLMVEAMQARRAGDAARAAALLAEYQHQYPEGAFQEEALALSIESAAARGTASASRLATDYLRRYPSGRFRELAQRVLKSENR